MVSSFSNENSRFAKNKIFLVVIGIIVIAIIILAIVFIFNSNKGDNVKTINDKNVIGKWKAVSESYNGAENNNPNIILELNNNGSYKKISNGIEETGKYKVINENILFYDTEDELNAYMNNAGRFDAESGRIKNNQLELINQLIPSFTVYKKV